MHASRCGHEDSWWQSNFVIKMIISYFRRLVKSLLNHSGIIWIYAFQIMTMEDIYNIYLWRYTQALAKKQKKVLANVKRFRANYNATCIKFEYVSVWFYNTIIPIYTLDIQTFEFYWWETSICSYLYLWYDLPSKFNSILTAERFFGQPWYKIFHSPIYSACISTMMRYSL